MKKKLSSWWEEKTGKAYVAKRSLVMSERAEKFAPFTRFIIYYCSADFTAQKVEAPSAGLTYLIQGEKEPPNALGDSPWTRRTEELMGLVGGAIRQDVAQIIPVLYISMEFDQQVKALSFSSDQVPLSEDENRTVRVVCGQFENVAHNVPVPEEVTVLDVVLNQGGNFTWRLPERQQAFVYVLSGSVQIGREEQLDNCRADTLVWVKGKQLYVSAACSGGRFIVGTLPSAQKPHAQEVYVQEILPDLDHAKNKY